MSVTTKRAMKSFVVSKAAQTTMPVTGTLNNSSTGNVNLNDGQLGLVAMSSFGSVALNAFTDATPTMAEAPILAIYQGTSASANVAGSTAAYPLWVRSFEKTQNIDFRNNVVVTKQPFRLGKHSAWVVGNISSATSGVINVLDETQYTLYVSFNSRRFDEHLATGNQVAGLSITKVTPDFSALAATYPLPIDWIVTHFGYEVNRNSDLWLLNNRYQGTDPVIAFAAGIANSGPAAAAAGTAISSLTAGTSFTVFNYAGVAKAVTFTQEMIDTLNEVATDSAFTHIFTIDTANAGTNVGGTATGLILMGLDSKLAYIDRIPQKKMTLRVGLKAGFDYLTVRNLEAVRADEGQGYGRVLDLLYQATQGQRKYAQQHTQDPVINFTSPVETGGEYTLYNIHHNQGRQIDTTNFSVSPFREIVAIPRFSTGVTPNPLIATFDSTLNSILSSSNNASIVNLG